jgi:DNA modification methylase
MARRRVREDSLMGLPEPYYEQDGIRIFHADCREILPELADASVDFIWTDPPYGHNNNNNGDLIHRREAALGRLPCGADTPLGRPIANDGAEANYLIQWFFREAARLLKPGCCCCCCCGGGGGPDPQFARWSLWMDDILDFKQMVVWDKGPMGMGWHYRRSYETVLVGQKPGAACRWYDTTDRVENIIRDIPKIIPGADSHPTPKPDALIRRFLRVHAKPGDLVVDPFMGHGGSLDVARLHGCAGIGIDVNEAYCAAAADKVRQGVLFGAVAASG